MVWFVSVKNEASNPGREPAETVEKAALQRGSQAWALHWRKPHFRGTEAALLAAGGNSVVKLCCTAETVSLIWS